MAGPEPAGAGAGRRAFAWSIDTLWLAGAADVVAQALVRPRAAVRAVARGVRHGARHARRCCARASCTRRACCAWLSWRRLHPARALLLPVDLLEGVTGARRGARGVGAAARGRRADLRADRHLSSRSNSPACCRCCRSGCCSCRPNSCPSRRARCGRRCSQSPPRWAQLLLLGLWWLVGQPGRADLRRRRLRPVPASAHAARSLGHRAGVPPPRRARARTGGRRGGAAGGRAAVRQPAPGARRRAAPGTASRARSPADAPALTPQQLLGESARAPDPRFERALDRAYTDPSLARTRKFTHWVLRTPLDRKRDPEPLPAWLHGDRLGACRRSAEYGLWILAALLLAAAAVAPAALAAVGARQLREEAALPRGARAGACRRPVPLPDDVPAAVSRAVARRPAARGAGAAVSRQRACAWPSASARAFPPGATEADCLRRARRARRRRGARQLRRGGAHLAARRLRAAVPRRRSLRRAARGLVATLPGGGMKRQHLLARRARRSRCSWAAGAWLFPRLFKPVTEDVPLPPTGEAAYNPLYALKLALLAHGQKVSSWPNLAAAEHKLGAHDTLLLYDRPEAMSHAQAQRLVAWVQRGGHLLMPGPPQRRLAGPLAGALGLRAVEAAGGRRTAARELRARRRLRAPARAGQVPADERGTWLCAAALPAGGARLRAVRRRRQAMATASRAANWARATSTIVELGYLDNDGLRDPAARALAYQLLAPGLGEGRMHLVYSADVPSLLRLLLEHAWMVLLPLLLALAAWLAWRGQRFGPLQPAPEPRRRALLEHVRAAGEFTWGRQRAGALHAGGAAPVPPAPAAARARDRRARRRGAGAGARRRHRAARRARAPGAAAAGPAPSRHLHPVHRHPPADEKPTMSTTPTPTPPRTAITGEALVGLVDAAREQVAQAFVGQAEILDQVLDRAARRRPRAARRRARPGQDAAGARARHRARLQLRARAVHARPDAQRHQRPRLLRPEDGRVPHPPRPGVHQPAARRRDQPRAGEDAGGAAGGDAGRPGDDRRPQLSRCRRPSW